MKRKTHWEIDRLNKSQRRWMARWLRYQQRAETRIQQNEWEENRESTNA